LDTPSYKQKLLHRVSRKENFGYPEQILDYRTTGRRRRRIPGRPL